MAQVTLILLGATLGDVFPNALFHTSVIASITAAVTVLGKAAMGVVVRGKRLRGVNLPRWGNSVDHVCSGTIWASDCRVGVALGIRVSSKNREDKRYEPRYLHTRELGS